MKRNFILAAALLLRLSSYADDFNLYYDDATSTTSTKIEAVSSLKKLIFENGNIVVEHTDGTTQTISVSSIQRLFFSTDATVTAIKEVKDDEQQETENCEVYDLTGRRINLAPDQLSKGIYIINGKKTLVK